ncbi:hypothetical protein APHAL10511_000766 [Amanita phalloides]|nr:hypothetical protein APHAL10511_000766 [Amanita phalloides]
MAPTISLGKHSKISPWNAFLWKTRQAEKENSVIRSGSTGKAMLQELVKGPKQIEYHALSKEQKAEVVGEYEQQKLLVAKGTCILARSRANDAVKTIGCIENMLDGLCSRSGMEAQLFAMRSLIDIPLKSITYSTARVENFTESTLKLDKMDILGRMEGYALQGLKGAAGNHNQWRATLRTQVRDIINHHLRLTSGIPSAKMEWKCYFRNVVKRYSVIIKGWPREIEFINLSEASSSIDTLEKLLQKWKQGTTYWKKLMREELERLEDERDAQIEDGGIQAMAPRRTHSDKGRKQHQRIDDDAGGDDDYIQDTSDGEECDESSHESHQRQSKRAKQTR